jgi:hypothetical protein
MGSGIEEVYIDCTRKRVVESLSDNNRLIKTYQDTGIKGYIGSQNDQPGFIAGKYTITTLYKFFTSDFEIKSGDYIIYENKTYECKGEPKNTAHQGSHVRIMVEKIENIKQL